MSTKKVEPYILSEIMEGGVRNPILLFIFVSSKAYSISSFYVSSPIFNFLPCGCRQSSGSLYPGKSRIFDGTTGDPFEQPRLHALKYSPLVFLYSRHNLVALFGQITSNWPGNL